MCDMCNNLYNMLYMYMYMYRQFYYTHSLSLVPSHTQRVPSDPATVAYQKPLKQPYVMRSLDWPTDVAMSLVPVSQPFWWEVLAQAKPYPDIVTAIIDVIRLPSVQVGS